MPVGTVHKQPAMDTHVYEVHFLGGRTKELARNTIAEALYAQCNPDSNQYVMLDAIVDCRMNPHMVISWNDHVKIINEDGSCTVSGRMAVLLDRNCQISRSLTHSRLLSLHLPWALLMNQLWTHKFVIELPKTVDEASAITKATGTIFWCKAIDLEIKNVWFAFDVLVGGPRHQQIISI
ncbi:hypothetical protein ACHAW6_004595 [Cyclotella cf. meneghiniana]